MNSDAGTQRLTTATYDGRLALPSSVVSPLCALKIGLDYLGRMTRQRLHYGDHDTRDIITEMSPGDRVMSQQGADGERRELTYDNAGRLIGSADRDLVTTIVYDGLSRVSQRRTRTVADGRMLTERFRYDMAGRAQTLTIDTGDTAAYRHVHFGWYANGKLATRQWEDAERRVLRRETYRYDLRGRLVEHRVTASTESEYPADESKHPYSAQQFTYDAIDNLLCVQTHRLDGNLARTTYDYDTVDVDRIHRVRYESTDYHADRTLSYDANGNLIDDENGHTVRWDHGGRLVRSGAGGSAWAYAYDPANRIGAVDRDGRIERRFYDAGVLSLEESGNEKRRYVRVDGVAVAETRLAGAIRDTWLVGTDLQGSVAMEAGDTVRTRIYEAYGRREPDGAGAKTGFSGEVAEETTGWFLLGDRIYDPGLRRFLAPDVESPFDAGGLNRYAYCGSDPVNRIDPEGTNWLPFAMAGLGLIFSILGLVSIVGSIAIASTEAVAAMSTPTLVMNFAAAVAEVGSIAVESGAIAAEIRQDEGLADLLGFVGLGVGVLSLGTTMTSKFFRVRTLSLARKIRKLPEKTVTMANRFIRFAQGGDPFTEPARASKVTATSRGPRIFRTRVILDDRGRVQPLGRAPRRRYSLPLDGRDIRFLNKEATVVTEMSDEVWRRPSHSVIEPLEGATRKERMQSALRRWYEKATKPDRATAQGPTVPSEPTPHPSGATGAIDPKLTEHLHLGAVDRQI